MMLIICIAKDFDNVYEPIGCIFRPDIRISIRKVHKQLSDYADLVYILKICSIIVLCFR